ncbi:putative disease resistance protein RGA3 isoform X1 [Phaseolus vulgaris]|uniref:putative disease resistance protein RGA3 isoform X1 n=1 Tax=Phaseolus vulgaris TaxID=3885 RepID=UPI0035C992FF
MTEFMVESLLHKLNSLIQKEFAPFLSFHQDLRKLADLFTTIKPLVEDAEHKQFSDTNTNVWLWLVKINIVADVVDYMIDECAYEAFRLEYQEVKGDLSNKVQRSCLSSFHLNHVVFGYKMAKKMKRISKRLIEIVQEKNLFNLTETRVIGVIVSRENEVIEGRPTTFFFQEPLLGRQRDIDKVLNHLISVPYHLYDLRVYSIEGEDGIGKTAFAKFIFHHQSVVDHFELRIWVGSVWDFSLKGMMEAITKAAIGCECEDLDIEILQKRLQYILQRKRYLIVLDFKLYLEHEHRQSLHDDWQKLKLVLACGEVGASILVFAPKSFGFAEIMGIWPFVLSELSDNDCWALFRQQVFKPNEEIPFELEAIGKEILKTLGGMPIDVKLLGALLHFSREGKEWLNVKEYVENFERIDHMILGYSLRSALVLSYLNLPTRLKKCFAYCAIFSSGETIRKAYLIELWMANGFLSSDGRLDAEDVGDDVWNELYRRSFFQDIERDEFGNLTGFKMHNIVLDFARLVAFDVKFLTDGNQLVYSSHRIQPPSNYRQKIELNSIQSQKVKSVRAYLISNEGSDELFPKILKCHSLRVLEFRLRGKLSPSIRDLKHLRYLNLSKSDFKTIPEFMCKLWNLQILILDYCKHLQKLPNSLTNLKSLEKLSFKGCHKLSNLPPHIGKLTSLRSLTSYFVDNERGFLLAELGGMKLKEDLDIKHLERVKSVDDAMEGNMSSKRLKELRLSWDKNEETKLGDNAEKILEVLQPDTEQLMSLTVIGYPGGSFPRWVFAHSLKKLHIERCRELKGLHKVFDSMTALHSLRLYDLPNLESLSDCFQHLRSLRQLAIGFCCKLTDFPNSLRASMLERLDIYGCYDLEKQLCYWSTILLSCEIRVDGCLITKGSKC